MVATSLRSVLVFFSALLVSIASAGAEVQATEPVGSSSDVDLHTLHFSLRWSIQEARREIAQPPDQGPDAARARGRLGDLYLVAGAFDAAAASYDEAAELNPDTPRWSHLAEAASRMGSTGAEAFSETPDPRLARVYVRLADRPPLLRNSPGPPAASIVEASFETFRQAVASAPRDAAARRDLGAALALTGRFRAAEDQLREAIRLDPAAASHRFLLFLVLESEDEDDPADRRNGLEEESELLRQAVEIEPENPTYRLALARRLAQTGQFAEATRHYEALAGMVPGDAQVLLERAEARLGTGDSAGALADARAAAEASPEPQRRAVAFQVAGEALSLQGRADDAAAAFRRAKALDPSLPRVHVGLGNLLGLAAEYERAATSYRRAIELDPSLVAPRLGEATALALAGRVAAAIDRLEEARVVLGDREPVLFNLARLLLESPDLEHRDPARAVELAEILVAGAPTPGNGELLAVALAADGRFGDAAAMQQNLLKAAPPNTDPELLAHWRERLERWRSLADDPVQAFSLTDQDGQTLRRGDLRGHVWLMHFFYVGCESPCRRAMDSMLRIQNELFNHPRADELRLVSVSVDAVMDTPSALADYAENEAYAYQDRWRFLTATSSEAARLAESAGVDLGTPTDGTLPGGETIVLVDRTGKARGTYRGDSEPDVGRLIADLSRLLTDRSGPTPAPARELPRVAFPPDAENPDWLEPRRRAQLEDARDLSVFHGFGFEDRVEESGITFLHRIVDDAGRDYKGVHYDHGNGVATADVDGDGHLDLYFTTQLGRNQLWRNRGDGTFEEITSLSDVDLGDRISVTASFADIDNDGDPDLFVTTVMDGNALFRNEGDGRFVDVSERAGVDHVGHSSGAVFFDFDRDGLLDLFVTNIGQYTHDERGRGGYRIGYEDAFSGHLFPERTETSLLYRNLGDGRFAEVSEEMGLVDGSWSGDAHPLDYDRDGWIDLYLLDMQGDDELYRNLEGKGFEKVSREIFPATPWGSMGIEVFDVDGDGRMDVFLTDMHSDMSQKIGPEREKLKSDMQWSEQALGHGGHHALGDEGPSIFGNALFLAREAGYVERSDAFGTENYWPWGVSAGDLNADGWVDVFVTASMNFPWRYGVNSVLLNEAGSGFRDAEFVLGVEPRFADGRTVTPWFPFDCSGELSHPVHELMCRGQEGEILVEGALGSRGSVLLDLERDGDLDVVTAEFNSAPQVLISDLDQKKDVRWAKIDLVGTRSNRDGLGARVTVTANERRQVKVLDGKSGYLSQSSRPLYFGLGDAEVIDRIEVEWPSGARQVLEGPIATGELLVLTEPSTGGGAAASSDCAP